MLYQNLPDYRTRVRPQPLAPRRTFVAATYQEPPKKLRLAKRPLFGFFAAALVAAVAFWSWGAPHGVAHAFNSLAQSSANQKAAVAREHRISAYKSAVNALIAAHPEASIAVSTVDLSSSTELTLGDQGTFTAASTAKLITAVVLLHEVERGNLTLNTAIDGQSAGTLLQNMIVNSDNGAWQSLNDYLTHDTLRAYTANLGWKDYDPDVNSLLPADMALLAQKLYQGDLLNKSHTTLVVSYMGQANKQEYIVDAVQAARPGLSVYHKAGWLDGLMHDVAIISDGKHSIVLAIYTYNNGGQGDTPTNQQLFKQITAAALNAYFPPAAATQQ